MRGRREVKESYDIYMLVLGEQTSRKSVCIFIDQVRKQQKKKRIEQRHYCVLFHLVSLVLYTFQHPSYYNRCRFRLAAAAAAAPLRPFINGAS